MRVKAVTICGTDLHDMNVRVGINGFGRSGRTYLRGVLEARGERPRHTGRGRIGRAVQHDDHVVSTASCTTNCLAPMVKGLDEQVVLEGPHKDLRRGRSAAVNITPTSTGAARAVGPVLPEPACTLDGIALRVPVDDGALTDVTAVLERPVTAAEGNAAFREAADRPLKGVPRVSDAPIVSRDIVGDAAFCVLDAPLTQAHGELVKVFGWYDNERGYTNRLLDLTRYVAARLPRG
ncbi:hypothetical protein [Streptomyces canus]|uniref:hypothetical protein n=1 Tax=Streptomyces canus TaxID=58343 RepID=UPI003866CC3E